MILWFFNYNSHYNNIFKCKIPLKIHLPETFTVKLISGTKDTKQEAILIGTLNIPSFNILSKHNTEWLNKIISSWSVVEIVNFQNKCIKQDIKISSILILVPLSSNKWKNYHLEWNGSSWMQRKWLFRIISLIMSLIKEQWMHLLQEEIWHLP